MALPTVNTCAPEAENGPPPGMRKSFLSQGCIGLGLAFEPGLRLREQIGGRHDLVDDAHAQRGLRIDALAFEHEGQSGHGADHAAAGAASRRRRG